MGRLAALAALGALSIALAPVAHADSNDDAYLSTLTKGGIAIESPIKQGHAVCKVLDTTNETFAEAAQGVAGYNDISDVDGAWVAGTAIAAYCPEYKWMMGS